jgi:hypothetical protein
LAAESLRDQVGLLGPELPTRRAFTNQEPAPPPPPVVPEMPQQSRPQPQIAAPDQGSPEPPLDSEPAFPPAPVDPEVLVPIIDSEVTQSPISSESESLEVPLLAVPGFLEDAINSALANKQSTTQAPRAPVAEQLKDAAPLAQKTTESLTVRSGPSGDAIAQEAAGPQISLEAQSQTLWPWLFLGLGGFVLLGALGIWRFSGR